jgi:hypothetical protein
VHALLTNNYIKYYVVIDYKIIKVVQLGLSNVKILKVKISRLKLFCWLQVVARES